jgi:hypothetical protein
VGCGLDELADNERSSSTGMIAATVAAAVV